MRFFALVAAACLVTACGVPGAGDPGTSSTGAPATPSTTGTAPGSTITTEESEMDLEQRAIADLAARLAVPEAEIETLRVETVTWPDGSLGCPQPGEMYAQALVEGHRIVLGHDERVFLYHSGNQDPPFLCPSGEKDGGYDFVPPPGFGET